MAARKTFEVAAIVRMANHAMKSDTVSDDEKRGVFNLTASILHETGNYRGYRYIDGWQGVETFRRAFYC